MQNIIMRGKYIHISTTIDSVRYRFSTRLLATKENLKLVKKDYKQILKDYISQKTLHCENSSENTIASFGNKVLSDVSFSLKENTLKRYYNVFDKYIKHKIGNVNIQDVTAKIAKELFITHFLDCSVTNRSLILCVLNKIFTCACFENLIANNPFSYVKNSKVDYIPKRNKALSYEDMLKVLHYVKQDSQHVKIDSKFKIFIAIAFLTGMRTGEILALHYEDIDLINKKIIVNKSISNNQITTTKTKNSRFVLISEFLLEFLKDVDLSQKGLIFVNSKGVVSSFLYRKLFLQVLELHNIPKTTLYSTRHTFASFMIEKTSNYQAVAMMLGHKDAGITFKSYVKSNINHSIFDFMSKDNIA